jgi:hypothetical protein
MAAGAEGAREAAQTARRSRILKGSFMGRAWECGNVVPRQFADVPRWEGWWMRGGKLIA